MDGNKHKFSLSNRNYPYLHSRTNMPKFDQTIYFRKLALLYVGIIFNVEGMCHLSCPSVFFSSQASPELASCRGWQNVTPVRITSDAVTSHFFYRTR